MLVKIIEDKTKDYFDLYELNSKEYNLATSKKTTEFMRSIGGIEEDAPYGRKSTYPDSTEKVYIGQLEKMPKYIQKQANEFILAQNLENNLENEIGI